MPYPFPERASAADIRETTWAQEGGIGRASQRDTMAKEKGSPESQFMSRFPAAEDPFL